MRATRARTGRRQFIAVTVTLQSDPGPDFPSPDEPLFPQIPPGKPAHALTEGAWVHAAGIWPSVRRQIPSAPDSADQLDRCQHLFRQMTGSERGASVLSGYREAAGRVSPTC
jgi:hypothetical protein